MSLPVEVSIIAHVGRGGGISCRHEHSLLFLRSVFRLDALALSVIATATWLAGWLAGCPSQPVLYQND